MWLQNLKLLLLTWWAVKVVGTSVLHPDAPLTEQMIPGETRVYKLESHLPPLTHYEVRISYPATQPMAFYMKLISNKVSLPQRQLLNTEKVMFRTNEEGKIEVGNEFQFEVYLEVRTEFEGASFDKENEKQAVTFNIVLETLWYGLPYPALKLGGVVGLLLGLSLIGPQLCPLLPKKLHTN